MLKENEITILSLHLGYGGIEQYVSSLAKMLEDNYKINIIATYKVVDKPPFPFSDKINITYLLDYGPNKLALKEAIKKKNLLAIFVEGFKSLKILFLKYYLNIKAIKHIDSKFIITTRDFHNKLVGIYARKAIIKIATEHNYHNNDQKYINKVVSSVKNFDYFVLVSSTLTKFYQPLVKPKCVFIPNIIDKLPDNRTSLKDNILVSIGRMEKEKGFDDLIDIISLVKNEIPNIKLYLMGDGSLRNKLENKVKELSLTDNIIFTGFIPKNEMDEYLTKAKLYVMTSHTESFGLVLLEAMSYGIPCIAFDSADGAKELLKDNVGILINNRDKEKMAKEIVSLLNNKDKLITLSKVSSEYAANYLPETVKDKWLNILNK